MLYVREGLEYPRLALPILGDVVVVGRGEVAHGPAGRLRLLPVFLVGC